MTAPARISQDDMDRAMKSVVRSGAERVRVIMRLEKAEIEIVIGDEIDQPPPRRNPWDEE